MTDSNADSKIMGFKKNKTTGAKRRESSNQGNDRTKMKKSKMLGF